MIVFTVAPRAASLASSPRASRSKVKISVWLRRQSQDRKGYLEVTSHRLRAIACEPLDSLMVPFPRTHQGGK